MIAFTICSMHTFDEGGKHLKSVFTDLYNNNVEPNDKTFPTNFCFRY